MRLNNEEFNVLIKGEDIVQLLKGIIRLKYNTITVFLKKIKIIFTFMIFVLLSFSSCIDKEIRNNDELSNIPYTEQDIQSNSETSQYRPYRDGNEKVEIDSGLQYVIFEKKYEIFDERINTDIKITYPQLKSKNSENSYTFVNTLIERTALEILESLQSHDVYVSLNYNISLATEKVLSVQFCGDAYIHGTAHPFQVWLAANLSLEDGRRLQICDLYDNSLQNYINDENFKFAYGVIEPAAENVKSLMSDYAGNDYHMSDFYLTPTKLGIVFELNFASGGYVQYEAEYARLASYKKENEIHNDLNGN